MRPQRGLVERQICNERRARLDRSYWPCVRAAIPPPSNHHCVCVSIWSVLGLPSSFLLERFRIYSPGSPLLAPTLFLLKMQKGAFALSLALVVFLSFWGNNPSFKW